MTRTCLECFAQFDNKRSKTCSEACRDKRDKRQNADSQRRLAAARKAANATQPTVSAYTKCKQLPPPSWLGEFVPETIHWSQCR